MARFRQLVQQVQVIFYMEKKLFRFADIFYCLPPGLQKHLPRLLQHYVKNNLQSLRAKGRQIKLSSLVNSKIIDESTAKLVIETAKR